MVTLSGVVLGFIAYGVLDWALNRRKRIPAATIDDNGNWSFPIDTFDQMLAIPVDRRERFLAELPEAFRRTWEMQDKYPLRAITGSMWTDDGLEELRPHVVNAPANAGSAFATRPLNDPTP
jgi:hypothetical protein